MEQIGRALIVFGVFLAVVGLVLAFGERLPFRLGRLPLDFHFERGNFSFYFPLGTGILISIILSAILMLINRR